MLLRKIGLLISCVLISFIVATWSGRSMHSAPVDDEPLMRADISEERIALTFDVTWGQEELTKILAVLGEHRVHATFFVGGSFLSLHGDAVRHIAAQGHEVGTLGEKIIDLSALPEQEITRNLLASQARFVKLLGRPVRYFRPPQGPALASVVRAARAANLTTVTYSLDAEDYQESSATTIARRIHRHVRRGEVVRLTASDWSKATAIALPAILEGLHEKGLTPVRLSDLVTAAK